MQLNVREAHQLVVRIMCALGHDAADGNLIADHLIDCGCVCPSIARARIAPAGSPRIGSTFLACCSSS
jgi:hypothetical protein